MVTKVAGTSATFHLVPQEIKLQDSKTKLKVVVSPNPPLSNQAQLFAFATNSDRKIIFSKPLKSVMKAVGWTKSNFKPLIQAVNSILTESLKDPSRMVGILDANIKNGFTDDFKLKYEQDFTCQVPQTIAIEETNFQVNSLSFYWLPKEVKVKDGLVKIKLTAVLASPCYESTGALVISKDGGKINLHYTEALLRVLTQISWNTSMLKPLEDYMIKIANQCQESPEFPISTLYTYLKQNYAPTLVIEKTS